MVAPVNRREFLKYSLATGAWVASSGPQKAMAQPASSFVEMAAGLKFVEVKTPTQIIPGGYLSGGIERVTAYEKGSPATLVQRGEKLEPDTFPGERVMFTSRCTRRRSPDRRSSMR
jgi:hypothetical protein